MGHLDQYDKQILRHLINKGESNANQIAENLGISWATTLKHLEMLSKMGYVVSKKKGKITLYTTFNY